MYVFEHKPSGFTTLHEVTAKEFAALKAKDSEDHWHESIHFTRAHAWVKTGGHHSTPLYTDEGRIRYARDGY